MLIIFQFMNFIYDEVCVYVKRKFFIFRLYHFYLYVLKI